MSVLVYSASTTGRGERVHRVIRVFFPQGEVEVFGTVEALSLRLRESKCNHDIAILVAASKDEMRELLCEGDLLGGLRVVLVPPEREDDTIGKEHSRRSLFLTCADSTFIDIAAVLSKMLLVPQ